MRSRIFSILALALILVTSLAMVGCSKTNNNGTPTPTVTTTSTPTGTTTSTPTGTTTSTPTGTTTPGIIFAASALTFSASPVYVGTTVTISATVKNTGKSGTGDVTLNIDGAVINTTRVTIAAQATQNVSFTYTPTTPGNKNVSITPGYLATGILQVLNPPNGSWDIQYNVASGSRILLNYSLMGTKGYNKLTNLSTGDGTVVIRVSKTLNANGTRDVTILSSGWRLIPINVKDISPGVSMNLTVGLNADAHGLMYVQSGVGDVDMSSNSSRTTTPKQINTFATGKQAPAGSMLVDTPLLGHAIVTIGAPVILPFGFIFTTGTITNVVSIPSTKFNGATMVSQGTPFAKDGALKVADYVGTPGTLTTTGTGDCLGLTLDSFAIDFQAEIKLVLEPVSVK